ncbi:class I SAM-dependent methyltransferase [Leptolyngbya sp. FACHB-17]|uniref:class I SAM-dependent methyltransferase n=1 Tax=unclassified Leptolyngbya TaxID=2650499 RepID=UPI0016807704|nr:class I SAM-dependent methyltransferase [Leptolyngbya sp. FACHB-17]MBD2082438.1 class I SAM-dependent methyltransferase [Leptolyngbya sp. FACHB-17]
MSKASPEKLEKIRQQFEFEPYPKTSIDYSPKDNAELMFIHNLVTPYYLRDRMVIDPKNAIILDAGCGTGSKCLALAQANPGAKIVGIDLSERSVEFARKRMEYHGIENAEFYAIGIEDLPQLGLEFDYINCDEVLYLFADIADGLRAMRSVLKPQGIIRSNLHSELQRYLYFRAQKLFQLMGLMDHNPEDLEIELAVDTLKALKPNVQLKRTLRSNPDENRNEWVLMNLLFQEDKGYTIPDLFDGLRRAGLEFISMVNWQRWNLMSLFEKPDDLPSFLAMSLPGCSIEQQLHLYELFNAEHRLLDFWCGHSGQAKPKLSLDDWEIADWKATTVHLHPQLNTSEVRESLERSIKQQAPMLITRYLTSSVPEGVNFFVDSTIAATLLPLWDSPQPFTALADRYLKLKPVDSMTLEPVSVSSAIEQLTLAMQDLESYLYLLLESSD